MKVKLTKKCQLWGHFDVEDEHGNESVEWKHIKPVDKVDLWPALIGGSLALEEGFTLRHLFEFLKDYDLLHIHKAIDSYYAWYEKYAKNGILKVDPTYEYLEYERTTVIDRTKMYFKRKQWVKKPKLSFKVDGISENFNTTKYNGLLLIAEAEDADEFSDIKKGDITDYSISFVPLNKIIDLEIRIAPHQYLIEKDRERYKDWENREVEEFWEDDWRLTPVEFIWHVMEDLSPASNDYETNEQFGANLFGMVEDVKQQIENKECLKVYDIDKLLDIDGDDPNPKED